MSRIVVEQTPRARLDAVALTLLITGLFLTSAIVSSSPFTGQANVFGEVGDRVVEYLLEPLGWSAIAFAVGWLWMAILLIRTRKVSRILANLGGWLLIVICVAVAADWSGSKQPLISVAGPGGSIGAFVRIWIEDVVNYPWEQIIFAVSLALGLWMGVNPIVRWFAKLSIAGGVAIFRAAVWGNSRIGDASDETLNGFQKLVRNLARSPSKQTHGSNLAAPTPTLPPFTKEAFSDSRPETIPIHSHTEKPGKSVAIVRPSNDESEPSHYELPSTNLLDDPEPFPIDDHAQKLREVAVLLEKTFHSFGLNIRVVGIHTGPAITQYEVALEIGLRLNKVTNLADDLALNLRVANIRVVAPIPGRNTVGIEVPNEVRQVVRLKEVVTALAPLPKIAKYKLPIFLGKDVEGRPLAFDLHDMPHLLIAGRTGTGKSVCLNSVILSLLLTRRPDECRMILIDPKKVELSDYAHIPHLMTPVVKDEKKADAILAWAVEKMEERYEWLHRARVRKITAYNDLTFDEILRRINPESEEERRAIPRKMPYIMILIDEVGDLMMKMKKEIEGNIILLAQKSRAAGIHLILATQKPTVDVITGLIKSNLPARICFQVTNRTDSAVVLDEKGAERLLGKGDMLFLQNGVVTRAQGALVDDREIERVVNAVATDTPDYDTELLNLKTREQHNEEDNNTRGKMRERDPIYEQAVEIVVREQRGSTSLLQRALGIGYGKASRLIDFMAEDGIVGSYNGSNARQVLVSPEEWSSRKEAG